MNPSAKHSKNCTVVHYKHTAAIPAVTGSAAAATDPIVVYFAASHVKAGVCAAYIYTGTCVAYSGTRSAAAVSYNCTVIHVEAAGVSQAYTAAIRGINSAT